MVQPPSHEPPGTAGSAPATSAAAGGNVVGGGAAVTGPVVQAGHVTGGVHLHQHLAAGAPGHGPGPLAP
ncbi:MAG: hypothetical protein HOY69_41000, partial [Streptomyces sp.]|nr:hypothetical protein [Streptomyces sp.]